MFILENDIYLLPKHKPNTKLVIIIPPKLAPHSQRKKRKTPIKLHCCGKGHLHCAEISFLLNQLPTGLGKDLLKQQLSNPGQYESERVI